MAKQTLTLEWDGALRIKLAKHVTLMAASNTLVIGIGALAQLPGAPEPRPVELLLLPESAAYLLAGLRDLELTGRIPKAGGRPVTWTTLH